MNSGPTAERVYEALKRRIMEHGFRPGDRLDPAMLAETLSSSVTPVREALHRLTGEGLVDTRTSEGFHLPAIDEPALKDLYGWTNDVLLLAVRGWSRARVPVITSSGVARSGSANWTAAIFLSIAERSSNSEHGRAVLSLNARLHAVRSVEPQVLDVVDAEIASIAEAVAGEEAERIRRLVSAYHKRRRRSAAALVRALYRTT
jgi:DNA-binding GntR family transcriptional regulator